MNGITVNNDIDILNAVFIQHQTGLKLYVWRHY